MTTSEAPTPVSCPRCGKPMRRELDGVREPPMPKIFWFCANRSCEEGKQNKIYSGG